MPKYDLKTLQAVRDLGLKVTFEYGGGFCSWDYLHLTPEQVLASLEGGPEVVIRLLGVDPEEYALWRSSSGSALCGQRLKSGKLCGKQVASDCNLEDWKSLHRNRYCHLHRG